MYMALIRVSYRKIFGGGGENAMCVEPCPPRGVWGHAPPGNFSKFTCSEVASDVPKMLKLAMNKVLSIKKYQLQNSRVGGGGNFCGRKRLQGGNPSLLPLAVHETLCIHICTLHGQVG